MDINNVLSYSLHIKTGKYAFGNCNTIFNANYFSNYSFYVYKYAAIICKKKYAVMYQFFKKNIIKYDAYFIINFRLILHL